MAKSFHGTIAVRFLRTRPGSALRLMAVCAVSVIVIAGAAWMYDREWNSLREKERNLIMSVVLQPSVDAATAYRTEIGRAHV